MSEHQHTIITGGGTGVGAEIALTLAGAGQKVTIFGRREEPLVETASKHENIHWAICDVTDGEAVKAEVAGAIEKVGALTSVIANAGTALSKPFAKLTSDDMQAMIDVNLMGTFNLFHAALPNVREAKCGRMIAIASLAGLKGYQYVSSYVAAKHAVVGLVRAMALELASTSVTVNAICPGFIYTPLVERSIENIMQKTGRSREETEQSLFAGNPQQRFIEVDEIAGAVLWLLSPAARSVNGQAIVISGGES